MEPDKLFQVELSVVLQVGIVPGRSFDAKDAQAVAKEAVLNALQFAKPNAAFEYKDADIAPLGMVSVQPTSVVEYPLTKSDLFWHQDRFWAFLPGAAMPLPLPVLPAQSDSKTLPPKLWQHPLPKVLAWTFTTLGVLLLALSDLQVLGSRIGLPTIPQGWLVSRWLTFGIFLYQFWQWLRAEGNRREDETTWQILRAAMPVLLGVLMAFLVESLKEYKT